MDTKKVTVDIINWIRSFFEENGKKHKANLFKLELMPIFEYIAN